MQTDIGCHSSTASCSGRDHTALPHCPQPRRAPQRLSRKARRQQTACQAQSITGQITPPAEKLARSSRVAVNDPEPAQQDELRRTSSPGQGQTAEERVGVLLLNLGGPETLNDVQPFLFNLFRDPDIIRLPQGIKWIQPTLAWVISSLRAPKSMEGYRSIGGGSPLRRITNEQAKAIAAQLEARGQPANVYVAMRYWKPFTEDAMEQVKRDKVTRLVILPLYPQFSISTSGSSLRLIQEIFEQDKDLKDLKHTVIPSWYQRPGYVTAMADLIQRQLTSFPHAPSVQLFFSAHGVPLSYVEEAGDPYREEMQECIKLIMQELQRRGINNPHTLAYQSRVGPVEWLRPYTDETIRNLGASGTKSMLAVPISFVSEHIETLEEIDVEYRELAESVGIEHWGRVPALNTNEVFIKDLSQAILEALPSANKMSQPLLDSLVPAGDVSTLLDTYDRDRRALPQPMLQWNWGWTASAETWNGRLAMLAIFVILLVEVATGQGALGRWLNIT